MIKGNIAKSFLVQSKILLDMHQAHVNWFFRKVDEIYFKLQDFGIFLLRLIYETLQSRNHAVISLSI